MWKTKLVLLNRISLLNESLLIWHLNSGEDHYFRSTVVKLFSHIVDSIDRPSINGRSIYKCCRGSWRDANRPSVDDVDYIWTQLRVGVPPNSQPLKKEEKCVPSFISLFTSWFVSPPGLHFKDTSPCSLNHDTHFLCKIARQAKAAGESIDNAIPLLLFVVNFCLFFYFVFFIFIKFNFSFLLKFKHEERQLPFFEMILVHFQSDLSCSKGFSLHCLELGFMIFFSSLPQYPELLQCCFYVVFFFYVEFF